MNLFLLATEANIRLSDDGTWALAFAFTTAWEVAWYFKSK